MVDRRSQYLKRKNTPTPFNEGPEMQNTTYDGLAIASPNLILKQKMIHVLMNLKM